MKSRIFRKAQVPKLLLWIIIAVIVIFVIAMIVWKQAGNQAGLLGSIFG